MMAAASAWDALSWQLDSFAVGYSSTLSELEGQSWSGISAAAMATAAAPYVAWATAAATLAEQAANQARAAAAAYEAAFTATVPPAAVTANRVQQATLLATNFFGQNTAAIAATEAAYAEMWAQDAAAMYGYAAAASAATALTGFQEPPNTTSAAPPSGQTAAVAQATVIAAAGQQDSLAALTSSLLSGTDGFNTLTSPLVFGSNTVRTAGQMGNYILALIGSPSSAPTVPAVAAAGEFELGAAGARGAVLAAVGEAAPVGGLSVPPSWPATPSAGLTVQSAQTLAAATQPAAPSPGSARSTTHRHSHLLPAVVGPLQGAASRRRGYPVIRMRDRRFRMPRPAVGG